MTENQKAEQQAGEWPNPIRQFLWDFLPKSKAPENSGIRQPEFAVPDWLTHDLVGEEQAFDIARREHQEGIDRAKSTEDKAHRLMQASLTLLALALALAGFQLAYLRDHTSGWQPLLLLVPTALAVSCLIISGIEGLEIDRVGIYWPPVLADLKDAQDIRRKLIEAELRGSVLADWTARHKVNTLLQARAWFSRGLIALLVASLISLGMVAAQGETEMPTQRNNDKEAAPSLGPAKR